MSPILYGVGVGPGDPELLTLKAARLIREADVVFCPAGLPGRARTIAAAELQGKLVVELQMEMRGDQERALRAAALTVRERIGAGVGVYLTEGDPSLYSTFGLLGAALAEIGPGLEVRLVPGVSSLTAAAAAAAFRLGIGEESLAVLPASAPPALIDDVLSTFDATVLLKPSLSPDLGARLRRLGLLDRSILVSEASSPSQRVLGGEAAAVEPAPYFSAWLVRGGAGAQDRGRVHFVGAGPGGAQHLTRRALSLLRHADLVIAADSLVAPEVIALARGRVVASSALTLEETVPQMVAAAAAGDLVVRLHSGDPSLYGAVSEQMAMLREAGCPYQVVPGVSSVFAVAAALGVELTEPAGAQTVILTRHGNRVPTPERERLRTLAAHGGTLAILLSAGAAADVERELLAAGLDPSTPAAVAYRVSWPDEVIERTTVAGIRECVRRLGVIRHTLILVGDALEPGSARSRLYDSGHAHVMRRRSEASAPSLSPPPALVWVTEPGRRLAQRLARALPDARLLSGGRYLPELYREGTPIVAFLAVGAAVRLLAPVLADKTSEPAVVAVDDGGRFAVSLLGGRAAGANRLASYVASVLGAEAVVTTAAERLGLPALDLALADLGWRVDDPRSLSSLEAAVVNGAPLGFYGPGLNPPPGFDFRIVRTPGAGSRHPTGLAVSDHELDDLAPGWALARPGRLVLGFGCATDAEPEAAVSWARAVLEEARLAPGGIRIVATIERRLGHPAAIALAAALGAELIGFSPAELDPVQVPNPSSLVRSAVGTGSVAEAAALLASRGRLLLQKRSRDSVSLAVAEVTG
ncbi:MAG TPA: precorrin-4 C(11)-methyltransferase [Candidatus Nitrosotalea sp.]|nr:precorrin-4 C(11)-methyltransferase [Candidatus Nitrosotalea sp.]